MSITLSHAELESITGYKQPAMILRELHRQGFTRARLLPNGQVCLERIHYRAVCLGVAAGAVEEPHFDFRALHGKAKKAR